jgi:hypothetical protein
MTIVGAPYMLTIRWWLFPLSFILIWFTRGFFVGLIDMLIHPTRPMDIIVEDNGLGVLIGTQRRWLLLDRILSISKYRKDTWTIYHYNGSIINIPVSEITTEQIRYLRDASIYAQHQQVNEELNNSS